MLHCSRNCSLSSGCEWSRTMPKTPRTARKLARAEVFLQRVYYLPACGRPTSRSHIDRRVRPSQGQDAGSSPVDGATTRCPVAPSVSVARATRRRGRSWVILRPVAGRNAREGSDLRRVFSRSYRWDRGPPRPWDGTRVATKWQSLGFELLFAQPAPAKGSWRKTEYPQSSCGVSTRRPFAV
jgi:hypothetical protein